MINVDGEIFLNPASENFGLVDPPFIRRAFQNKARTLADKLAQLIISLQAGDIGRRAFVRQSMRALQLAYYPVFSLGALSVDQFHVLTPQDIQVLNSELLGERKFLQSFARDLRTGILELAPELRARLYLAALRGVFELGRIQALPDRPLDWILGDTDHCEPCLLASLDGPYKRNQLSRLNLPVLPGIPGSGEVCLGLTKCGCTIRRPNFPANQALQLQLRDILASVVLEV